MRHHLPRRARFRGPITLIGEQYESLMARTLRSSSNESRVLSSSTLLGEQQETCPPSHWPSDLMIEYLPPFSECEVAVTARAKEMIEMIEAFIVEDWSFSKWRVKKNWMCFAVLAEKVDMCEMLHSPGNHLPFYSPVGTYLEEILSFQKTVESKSHSFNIFNGSYPKFMVRAPYRGRRRWKRGRRALVTFPFSFNDLYDIIPSVIIFLLFTMLLCYTIEICFSISVVT